MVFGLRLAYHAILKILELRACAYVGSPPYADFPDETHTYTGDEALEVRLRCTKIVGLLEPFWSSKDVNLLILHLELEFRKRL